MRRLSSALSKISSQRIHRVTAGRPCTLKCTSENCWSRNAYYRPAECHSSHPANRAKRQIKDNFKTLNMRNSKNFELMLMRCAKAYSSSGSVV